VAVANLKSLVVERIYMKVSQSRSSKGNTQLVGIIAMLLGIAGASLLSGQVPSAVTDASQHDASAVARARAAFLKKMSSHRPLVRSTAAAPAPGEGATSFPSYNWSGFADQESGSKTISSVTGDWVIPNVQCPGGSNQYEDTINSQWIGIDGFSNETVEQLGSATQCFEGVEYYYVWVEMFPAGTIEEGTQACINNNIDCPEPGDHISASVTVTPAGGTNEYRLSLTDYTHPQESFSVTASCAPATCADSSAEWIMERPAYALPFGFQIVPLASFSQTGFSNGTLMSGGKTTEIEGFKDGTVYDIPMIDDTDSYFLDCVGQQNWWGPQLLLTTNANACRTVSPSHGSFNITWDSSF
jgi:hypothetical protein